MKEDIYGQIEDDQIQNRLIILEIIIEAFFINWRLGISSNIIDGILAIY